MVRIACFADDEGLLATLQHVLNQPGMFGSLLSASALSNDIRQTARTAAADLILLELDPSLTNAHLIFFLRADIATRATPIILLSHAPQLTIHAAALGADAFLQLPATHEQIATIIFEFLPTLPAREVGSAPIRLPIALPT